MNEQQGVWWNILDTVSGIAIGVVSVLGAVFGWLSNKFKDVDKRMDSLEKDFNARNLMAATSIATLEAYHKANTQRLDSIDTKLDQLLATASGRKRGR